MFLQESHRGTVQTVTQLQEETFDFLIKYDSIKTETVAAEFALYQLEQSGTLTEADDAEKKNLTDKVKSGAGKAWDAVKAFAISVYNFIKRQLTTIGEFFANLWKKVTGMFTEAKAKAVEGEVLVMKAPSEELLSGEATPAEAKGSVEQGRLIEGELVEPTCLRLEKLVKATEGKLKDAQSAVKEHTKSGAGSGDPTTAKDELTSTTKSIAQLTAVLRAVLSHVKSVKKQKEAK